MIGPSTEQVSKRLAAFMSAGLSVEDKTSVGIVFGIVVRATPAQSEP